MADEKINLAQDFITRPQSKVMRADDVANVLAIVAKAGAESFVSGTQPDVIAKVAVALCSGGEAYLRFNAATLARQPEWASGTTAADWAANPANYTFTLEVSYLIPAIAEVVAEGDNPAVAAVPVFTDTRIFRLRATHAARLFSTETGDSFFVQEGGNDAVALVDKKGIGNVYQITKYAFEEPFLGGLVYPGQYYAEYDAKFKECTAKAKKDDTNKTGNGLTTEARREVYTEVNDYINDGHDDANEGVCGVDETVVAEHPLLKLLTYVGTKKAFVGNGKFIVNKSVVK